MEVSKKPTRALARRRGAGGAIRRRAKKDVERVAEAFAEALVLALMDQAEKLAGAIGRGIATAGRRIRDRFTATQDAPLLEEEDVQDAEVIEHELDS